MMMPTHVRVSIEAGERYTLDLALAGDVQCALSSRTQIERELRNEAKYLRKRPEPCPSSFISPLRSPSCGLAVEARSHAGSDFPVADFGICLTPA